MKEKRSESLPHPHPSKGVCTLKKGLGYHRVWHSKVEGREIRH